MIRLQRRVFRLASVIWILCGIQALAGEPLRIMPLGDSITRGTTRGTRPYDVPGGYRTELWNNLTTAEYTVDFVGAASDNPDPTNLPDPDHNGYNNWRIDQIDSNITGWLNSTRPAVVLLHIGTNDAIQNYDFSNVATRLDQLITHITAQSPQTHLIVAKIIGSKLSDVAARIDTYNSFIPGIVADHANNEEWVTMVDMTSVVPLGAFDDNYHPNKAGYDLMGDAWFGAIEAIGPISNPAPTPEPGTAAMSTVAVLCLLVYARRRRERSQCQIRDR